MLDSLFWGLSVAMATLLFMDIVTEDRFPEFGESGIRLPIVILLLVFLACGSPLA
jgi:hypothetical protein